MWAAIPHTTGQAEDEARRQNGQRERQLVQENIPAKCVHFQRTSAWLARLEPFPAGSDRGGSEPLLCQPVERAQLVGPDMRHGGQRSVEIESLLRNYQRLVNNSVNGSPQCRPLGHD